MLAAGTVSPAGSVSVKATPDSASTGVGLMIVKVSADVPPSGISVGAKLLAIAGGAVTPTASTALALSPVPPLVELIGDVVLTFMPAVVAVTLSEIVQDEAAARVAPERFTLPPPAGAVRVPPQELVR